MGAVYAPPGVPETRVTVVYSVLVDWIVVVMSGSSVQEVEGVALCCEQFQGREQKSRPTQEQ